MSIMVENIAMANGSFVIDGNSSGSSATNTASSPHASSTDGTDGCKCVNATSTLLSYTSSVATERSCTTADGDDGMLLSVDLPCADYSYGSSECAMHDLAFDPDCAAWLTGASSSDTGPPPEYCYLKWCYVNATECMAGSEERVFRSDYFSADSGVDLVRERE